MEWDVAVEEMIEEEELVKFGKAALKAAEDRWHQH